MDVAADAGFRRSPGWLFVLVLLLAAQGWLTLRLFGPGLPFERMTNDEPVLDGRHPLHSYHGLLGNRSWHERRSTTCYDPAFQAGYLKTPVFDAGSRPAELFFLIGGPSAGSYKIGLAICCLLAPLAFAVAARGAGLGAGGSCLAAVIGGTLWWSPACRALLEAGDVDLLVGGMCVPVYLTWLSRFGARPARSNGWFLPPVPPSAGTCSRCSCSGRFPSPFCISSGRSAAYASRGTWDSCPRMWSRLGANSFWLSDWATHLWMYVPYGGEECPHSICPASFREWEAFLPHDPVDLAARGHRDRRPRGHGPAEWRRGRPDRHGALRLRGRRRGRAALAGLGEVGAQKVLSVGVWCCAVPGATDSSQLPAASGRPRGFGHSAWCGSRSGSRG